jgi:integrase
MTKKQGITLSLFQLLPYLSLDDSRLQRWAEVFEDWLEARERDHGAMKREQAQIAWKDFLGSHRKPPWEVETDDVNRWVEELQNRGLKPSPIYCRLLEVSKFYQFFHQDQVKSGDIQPDVKVFDPTRGVKRIKQATTQEANYLSVEEARAFLGAIDKEISVFGKRDYALMLTHLVSGLRSKEIRMLRWGDILKGEQCWQVRRGNNTSQITRLPEVVAAAIMDYLEEAGRLESIQEKDFVFAPFIDPLRLSPGGKASDWDSQKPISQDQVRWLLNRYATWAGLDERKITCQTLHNTAAILRLEAGDDFQQIQAFMGHERLASTIHLLDIQKQKKKNLMKKGRRAKARPYQRKTPARNTPGNLWALKHGFYALKMQDKLVKEAMLYSKDKLASEIAVQRVITRRAFELYDETENIEERFHLMELVGLGCWRVSRLMLAQHQLGGGEAGTPGGEKTEFRVSPELEELVRNVEKSLRAREAEKENN